METKVNRGPVVRVSPVNRRIGLGTAIKTVTTAIGIKPCSGCQKRAVVFDGIIPNINPLAKD